MKSKVDIPSARPAFTGKAGEYAVLSELLFNEFNASLMSVDQGIDIVASKDNKFIYIQVKTANNRNGSFYASINKSQFERFNASNTFYIFVLRYFLGGLTRSDFIVLKNIDIEKLRDKDVIKNGDNLSINISIVNRKIMLNGREDISWNFNNINYLTK
jgi:Holliday junction resolvase-like predicted endonuclease